MTTPVLRAAVIGLGVGEQHVLGFQRAEAVEVVALCDKDPAKLEMARRTYPQCRLFESAEELIAHGGIDVLSIASNDDHHAAQVIAALDNGMHVFCEKPLCTREEDLRAIQAALVRNSGLRLSTNTVLRASPRFVDLKRRVVGEQLGRLYYLEADYNYGRLHKLGEGWRGEILDYSVMLGGGVHMVDLALWLTGRRVVEVVARGNKICSEGYPFHTPDMVVALLTFDDGTLAKITANFGCVFPHFHRFLAYGTKATFENGAGPARLYRSRDKDEAPEWLDSDYPGVRKGDLLPPFIDAIRGHGRPVVDEAEVVAMMSVCFAIDRAWRTGQSVKLEQPA